MSAVASPDVFEVMKALIGVYPAAYQTLYDAKPITCSVTGTTFDAIPAPCAAVLDVSHSNMLHITVDGDESSWLLFLLLLVLCPSSITCY